MVDHILPTTPVAEAGEILAALTRGIDGTANDVPSLAQTSVVTALGLLSSGDNSDVPQARLLWTQARICLRWWLAGRSHTDVSLTASVAHVFVVVAAKSLAGAEEFRSCVVEALHCAYLLGVDRSTQAGQRRVWTQLCVLDWSSTDLYHNDSYFVRDAALNCNGRSEEVSLAVKIAVTHRMTDDLCRQCSGSEPAERIRERLAKYESDLSGLPDPTQRQHLALELALTRFKLARYVCPDRAVSQTSAQTHLFFILARTGLRWCRSCKVHRRKPHYG
ncbi:unnamed protein product [Parajaminaea phylloscopi]